MSRHEAHAAWRWQEALASGKALLAKFLTLQPSGQDNTARSAGPEFGTIVFLAGLLLIVTAGILSLVVFEPATMVETERAQHPGWRFDWPVLVAVFVLVVEIALIATILVENRARRAAEGALRASEERMALAAESACVGLWRWKRAEGKIWLSDFGLRLLGLPSAVTTPDAFGDYIHPDDRAMVIDAIAHAVGEGYGSGKTYEIVYRFLPPGSTMRWLRMRGSARRIGDSDAFELAGIVADITETKEMLAQIDQQRSSLLHLSRISVLGELSGALAHELKQPLTAIMSNAQAAQRLLDRDPIDFKELRDAIGDIVSDDARAGDVITHLRALLKRESTTRAPVDLNTVVSSALELTKGVLTERGINVMFQRQFQHLTLSGDQIQLQQLLLNLILNAAEAMSATPAGALLITTDRVDGDDIHLAVSDTGTGIAPDLLTRLFDPLITTKPHGLGLGLSISQAIAEAHGGKIWAINNPSRGATFHVQFPNLQKDFR
jgi:signal transduction histidine kinase